MFSLDLLVVAFYFVKNEACIDKVPAHDHSEEIDRLLITKEAYWSAQLFSLAPYGLNKRKEFHSENR